MRAGLGDVGGLSAPRWGPPALLLLEGEGAHCEPPGGRKSGWRPEFQQFAAWEDGCLPSPTPTPFPLICHKWELFVI